MGRISNFLSRRYQNVKRTVNRGMAVPLLKNTTKMMWESALFWKQKPVHPETFDTAVNRLHLSAADLKEREKSLKIQIAIFSFNTVAVLIYALYLGIAGQEFMSAIIALLVSVAFACCAFRSHFWLFQVKHKKLGCSIQEWLNSSVNEPNQP